MSNASHLKISLKIEMDHDMMRVGEPLGSLGVGERSSPARGNGMGESGRGPLTVDCDPPFLLAISAEVPRRLILSN